MRTSFIQDRIARYRRKTIALRPYTAKNGLANESHFGGAANMAGLPTHPVCPHCATPLGFVLQVYKRDVPEAYFPAGADLFQLVRCPNDECDGDYAHYDKATLVFYSSVGDAVKEGSGERSASVSKICAISPKAMDDMPNYDDYPETEEGIEEKYGEELDEFFTEEHSARSATKFGGWPSFTQSPFYPTCSCGKVKEFFFQLASEDPLPVEGAPKNDEWSPHGIMMGDVGNVYFYVCKTCGPSTIESYFDCC